MDVQTLISNAGGVGKLAARLKVSHSTVCDWKRAGFLPGARAFQISRELGVPLDQLSPLIRDTEAAA